MVVCYSNEKEEIIRVQALYNFEGKNNDELTFKKGDIIVLTQAPSLKIHKDCQNLNSFPEKVYENDPTDWWEGYFGSKIGWFPCNYVEMMTEKIDDGVIYSNLEKALPITQNILKFHKEVLINLTTFETDHVSAIHETLRSYVRPLHRAGIMNLDEYNVVLSNLEHIAIFHTKLLTHLTNQTSKPVSEQRVGHLYLMIYPKLSALLSTYCQNHPAAMALVVTESKKHAIQCFLTKKENIPSCTSDLNVKWQKFCSSLSQPFRHIERYTTFFKELDRLLPENHMDRGDIIRARELMSQLTIDLQELRKSKELEIEILNSTIEGWEGEPISTLGPVFNITRAIIISRSVDNKAQKTEASDFDIYKTTQNSERYFILFSQTLLLLSPNSRLNGFIYQGKLPLVNLSIVPTESPISFVVHSSLIDPITARCESQATRDAFISAFQNSNSCTSVIPLYSNLLSNSKNAQNYFEPTAKMDSVNVVSTPLPSNLPHLEIQNVSNGASNKNNDIDSYINTESNHTFTANEQSYMQSIAPPPVHLRRRKDHPHMNANTRDLYESAVSLLTTASTNLDQSRNSYPGTKINQPFQLQSPNESVYENAFSSYPMNSDNDYNSNNNNPNSNIDSNKAFISKNEIVDKDTYSVIDSLSESELKALFSHSSKFQLTPLPCLRPILHKSITETTKTTEKGPSYDKFCLQFVEALCSADQESIIVHLEDLYEKGVNNAYSKRNKSHGSTICIDQKLENVYKRLDILEASISQIKTAVGTQSKNRDEHIKNVFN